MTRPIDPYWPSHASEPTHRKTYQLAEILKIHPMQAYGHIRAFRTRYPQEAGDGVLYGGAAQVERLALWDGAVGTLAAAFSDLQIVDIVDGRLIAHDHDVYVGAAQQARTKARTRTDRWRKKNQEGEGDVTSQVTSQETSQDTSRVTSRVTSQETSRVTSLALTHSLSSCISSAERGSGGEAESTDPHVSAPQTEDALHDLTRSQVLQDARQARNGKRRAASAILGAPQSVDALLTQMHGSEPLAAIWGRRFLALDGRNGRRTIRECLLSVWPYWDGQWNDGGERSIAWFATKLSDDNEKAKRSWERDGSARAPGEHPRWQEYRRRLDAGEDLPSFELWLAKADELGARARTSGGGRPPLVQVSEFEYDDDAAAEGIAALRAAVGGAT